MTISSRSNASVSRAAKLHQRKHRRQSGMTLIEGPHVLEVAMAAGAHIDLIFALEEDAATMELAGPGLVLTVTRPVLEKVATTGSPRGPVAVMKIEPRPLGTGHALALWQVGDPGNAGTLVRTAAAFGVDIMVGPDTADLWSPKVLRAAAGAHFMVGMDTFSSVAQLKARGYAVIAAVPTGGDLPANVEVGPKSALLVGNEAHGLGDEVLEEADRTVALEMPGGTESLNAAVAGSILAYALFGS